MDHHSPRYLVSPNRILRIGFSIGGSVFLIFTLGLIEQGAGYYLIFIIIAAICALIKICARCMNSETSGEETVTNSTSTQYTVRPSAFDVENQPSPHSLGPMYKYPKTCPSCGKPLEEGILKQLIISGQAKCTFCGNQIQISKNS